MTDLSNLAPPWRSFVVIDTETNGLDEGPTAHPDPRVVELGAVRFDDGVVTARFSTPIRTGVPIPPEATAIHGITDERCATAPTIAEAWPGVLGLYEDGQVVTTLAFNASFDGRYLRRDVKRARDEGAELPKPPRALAGFPGYEAEKAWMDALPWCRHEKVDSTRYGKGNHTLSAVCGRLGIVLERAHSAEADAVAAGQVWLAIREKVIACVQSGDLMAVLRVQSALIEKNNAYWLRRNGRAA